MLFRSPGISRAAPKAIGGSITPSSCWATGVASRTGMGPRSCKGFRGHGDLGPCVRRRASPPAAPALPTRLSGARVSPARARRAALPPASLERSISSLQPAWHVAGADVSRLPAVELARLDAVVVLGGGLGADGVVPEVGRRRLQVAREIKRLAEEARAGKGGGERAEWAAGGEAGPARSPFAGSPPALLISGGGSPHNPPALRPNGQVLHESDAYASWILSNVAGADEAGAGWQLDAQDVYTETSSYDTVGNAYFSLVAHALPAGWRRLALVTSDFHMRRSEAIFRHVFERVGSEAFGRPVALFPIAVSDRGLFPERVLAARVEKEEAAAERFRADVREGGVHSLAALHAWLHATHLCYSQTRAAERGAATKPDGLLAQSY